jgi:hypothetical protein
MTTLDMRYMSKLRIQLSNFPSKEMNTGTQLFFLHTLYIQSNQSKHSNLLFLFFFQPQSFKVLPIIHRYIIIYAFEDLHIDSTKKDMSSSVIHFWPNRKTCSMYQDALWLRNETCSLTSGWTRRSWRVCLWPFSVRFKTGNRDTHKCIPSIA